MNPVKAASEPPFPGRPAIDDGSGAVVWVETHISQAACAYPITPTTNMGVQFAQAVAGGFKNLWGDTIRFIEAESEHSSASAAEGFALAGGRVTNFTSGQGLVLMKEVLYVISGKRLPAVFNIGARALSSQALNVHAGHDDVMGVADAGWGMLFARNAQEAADLCLVCRRVAEATETPFMNVQDGFLTTHTLETLSLPEPELMAQYVGAPAERLRPVFDPARRIMSGVVQNQDAYMKGKIAQRYFYDRLVPALEEAMQEFTRLTGRHYGLVSTYRMEDADYALVAMGSMAETAETAADYLRESRGLKVGVVHPTAFRPFPGAQLVEALKNVVGCAVVERMDSPTSQSNPLTAELKAAFMDALSGDPAYPKIHRVPLILSGAGGLGGRDVRPGDFIAVVDALKEERRSFFSLNVQHPSALTAREHPDVRPPGAFSLRGYSIGGYGSVTTNKVIAQVAGGLFGVRVQAYPKYGSEKKGLPTNYYLTLAHDRVRTHCEMLQAEFIPLNTVNALRMGNALDGLSPGGLVFVQWSGPAEALWQAFPQDAKRAVRRAGARVFYLDAAGIARAETSHEELSVRMQGIVLLGVFLRCAPFREQLQLSDAVLLERAGQALHRTFGKLSEEVVAANLRCVERGYREVMELPPALLAQTEGDQDQIPDHRHVSDAMHAGVITCGPEDTLSRIVETMSERHISAVVVVNGQHEMVGIVSSTDIARAYQAAEQFSGSPVLARHLMTPTVLVTWPDEPLAAAVERMMERRVHRLVVVPGPQDTRHAIGILSLTDLAQGLRTQA